MAIGLLNPNDSRIPRSPAMGRSGYCTTRWARPTRCCAACTLKCATF